MVGSVCEEVLAKTHEGNELWESICNRDSVLQKKCVLVDEEVLRVKGSCSRSVRESQMCAQSLLELVLAGSSVMIQNTSFLLI